MNNQIRILHVLYSMNRGGAETMIMNYYRHIDKRTVQFDFLISAPKKCAYEDEIIALGGQVFRVPILSKSPFHYIKAVDCFFKTHKEYKIVHAHTSAKNALPLGIAKWNKVPIRICHSHSIRNENGITGCIKNILKYFIKYVSTDFIACSKNAGIWLYGEDFYRKNGILLQNVIDVRKYKYSKKIRNQIREQQSLTSSFIIGNVGRFGQEKNHEFIIDLFDLIHQKTPNAVLLLIGDGVLKKSMEKKVSKLELDEFVIFKGVIDNVSDYMQAMDAFLLPSLYEGLPLTIVEAQASGLKCFISEKVITKECDLTGLVEFISLDETPAFWADRILSSLKYTRKDFSERIISSGYDASKSAKYLQDFYLSKS